jgi:antitoxin ParD1/3/4
VSTGEDPAKLRALEGAAEKGWADIAAGRFTDVAEDDLDDFISELGARVAARRP